MSTLLQQLFDNGEYTKIASAPDVAVVAAMGRVAGFSVFAYAQDMGVKSGAVNQNAAAVMRKVYAMAVKTGAPVIAVFNSKGGDIETGSDLVDAYSDIIENAARLSGVVPLISIISGQCSGLNAVIARMSDFVIMRRDSEMFFTPPFLANGEPADSLDCEAAADIIVKDEPEAMLRARELLSLLPPNNLETAFCADLKPNEIVITENLRSRELIAAIADKDSLLEISDVTALGVLNTATVGFVCLGPEMLGPDNADKISRFVSFCDAFSIPVVTVVDNEGFEPCSGLIRTATRLAQVYASATTPKITLITGRAAGAAFILSGGTKSDFVLAYDGAVISPLPIKTAAAFLEVNEEEYIESHAGIQNAVKKGYVDLVISPHETRNALANAIEVVKSKRVAVPSRKHINLVL